jgi:AbiV family abortive infection protein
MNPLSLPQVEILRALVLENAAELLAEAELLFGHQKYARACALAHLSSEELAKLPMLAGVGIGVLKGDSIDWKKFERRLSSHSAKLKVLLFVDLLGTNVDPTIRDVQVHKLTMSRIELFNVLKNATLYAGVNQDGFYKPSALFGESYAKSALTLSRNRFQLFAEVEAFTRGRLAQLANSSAYMRLLKTLRTGDDG